MKQVTISVEKEKRQQIVDLLESKKEIKRVVELTGNNCNQFILYLSPYIAKDILDELDKIGCGVSHGIVTINELDIVKPINNVNKKYYNKFGVLPYEQIYMIISSSIQIDIDFVLYLVIASIIAGIGLATNDILMVVASMLLSPLLNPILGLTYGTIIKDKNMCISSMKTLIISIICVYICGIIIAATFFKYSYFYNWPTEEMEKRGQYSGLITSLFIAIASGVGAGISISSGGINSLVGVAIAASIHPPLINSAICFAFGIFSGGDTLSEYTEIGGLSLLLFIINIVCIYLVGLIIFKLKGASPFRRGSVMWQFPKFGKEDTQYDSFDLGRFRIRFTDTERGDDIIELHNTQSLKTYEKKKDRSEKEIKELLDVHMREAHIIKKFLNKHINYIREEKRMEKEKEKKKRTRKNIETILQME
jgi:uncharacterized hydrophobic protein (TIGR00341 family)